MNTTPHAPLVLASGSPYRRALLDRLGLPFEVDVPAVDEAPLPAESPRETALRLSCLKAGTVAKRRPDALVIGSDQVAECEGRAFGKPGHHAAAVAQWHALRGKVVQFHSGLCVVAPTGPPQCTVITTSVTFRNADDDRIERYLRRETPYDCAGAAKAEGLGIALLERIDSDDPTALIGLPLIALTTMLEALGRRVV